MQLTAHPQQVSERRRAELVVGQRFGFSDTLGVLSGFWYQSGWLQSGASTGSGFQKLIKFRRGSIGLLSKWGYLEWECDRANANWIAPNEQGVATFSQHLKWGGVGLGKRKLSGQITRGRDHRWQLAAHLKQKVSPGQSLRLGLLRSASRDAGGSKADWRLTLGLQWALGQQQGASPQSLWDELLEDRLASVFDYGFLGRDTENNEPPQSQDGSLSEGSRGNPPTDEVANRGLEVEKARAECVRLDSEKQPLEHARKSTSQNRRAFFEAKQKGLEHQKQVLLLSAARERKVADTLVLGQLDAQSLGQATSVALCKLQGELFQTNCDKLNLEAQSLDKNSQTYFLNRKEYCTERKRAIHHKQLAIIHEQVFGSCPLWTFNLETLPAPKMEKAAVVELCELESEKHRTEAEWIYFKMQFDRIQRCC